MGLCIEERTFDTTGIQKHGTMSNIQHDAYLLGGNIKGGLFRGVHIHKCDNAPTVTVRTYKEYDLVDNSVEFLISMWYI